MVQYLETLSMSTIFVPHDVKPNEKCSKSRSHEQMFLFLTSNSFNIQCSSTSISKSVLQK